MGTKKLTLAELRERRDDIDQGVLRVRKVMEAHKIERDKLYSAENRRRLSPQGLREDEDKLRRAAEQSLATVNTAIAKAAQEAGEHRDSWTREHVLRNARFGPEFNGTPGTTEAKTNALLTELLEDVRRGNAERRAARFTPEELAIETAMAAEAGHVALVALYENEAHTRKLQGLEKLVVDTAAKKLQLPDVDEAQTIYKNLEDLTQEADGLFTLWKEPGNQMAQSYEALGRFNRKKRAEAFVKMIEEAKVSEAEAFRLQWHPGHPQEPQQQQADAPEPPIAA